MVLTHLFMHKKNKDLIQKVCVFYFRFSLLGEEEK